MKLRSRLQGEASKLHLFHDEEDVNGGMNRQQRMCWHQYSMVVTFQNDTLAQLRI